MTRHYANWRSCTVKAEPTDEDIWEEVYSKDGYRARSVIRPGDIVVDVGAHHGSFSLLAAEQGAIVYAFEPETENFKRLQKTAEFGFLPFNCAITGGITLKQGTLMCHPSISAAHSMCWSGVTPTSRQTCWMVPIDCVIAMLGRVDVLKLDCEGMENAILAQSSLLHKVGRLIVEWHKVNHGPLHDLQEFAKAVVDEVFDLDWIDDHSKLSIGSYTRKVSLIEFGR